MNDRYILGDIPSHGLGTTMYDRILLATDGRTNTRAAIGYAIGVANRDQARLDAVYVNERRSMLPGSSWTSSASGADEAGATAASFLSNVREEAEAHSIECTTGIRDGNLVEVVPSHVHEEEVDHVVITRNAHRTLFDRITAVNRGKLARQLEVPVTFVGNPTPREREERSANARSATIE